MIKEKEGVVFSLPVRASGGPPRLEDVGERGVWLPLRLDGRFEAGRFANELMVERGFMSVCGGDDWFGDWGDADLTGEVESRIGRMAAYDVRHNLLDLAQEWGQRYGYDEEKWGDKLIQGSDCGWYMFGEFSGVKCCQVRFNLGLLGEETTRWNLDKAISDVRYFWFFGQNKFLAEVVEVQGGRKFVVTENRAVGNGYNFWLDPAVRERRLIYESRWVGLPQEAFKQAWAI